MSHIKVDATYTTYHDRGLTLADSDELGPVGSYIVIVDRDLEFTRHRIMGRAAGQVRLSIALPWPQEHPYG